MVETVSFLDFLETIGVLAALIFVLSSMFGMRFSLTVREVIEPLKNIRLVIHSLVANFYPGTAARAVPASGGNRDIRLRGDLIYSLPPLLFGRTLRRSLEKKTGAVKNPQDDTDNPGNPDGHQGHHD